MSAVLEQVQSPIERGRAGLDAARAALVALDQRMRAVRDEADAIDMEQCKHRTERMQAASEGRPMPKAPKLRHSDAAEVLPVLQRDRARLIERITEAEGGLRGAIVTATMQAKVQAIEEFAKAAALIQAKWLDIMTLDSLLQAAGIREPMPPRFSDFSIPAIGRMTTLCENHWAHFAASHSVQQGLLNHAVPAMRARLEADLGERLPW